MDKWEAKQRYVDRRNSESEEIGKENGLTDEQIQGLEWLAKVRHELHSGSATSFYHSESSNNKYFNCLVDSDYESENYIPTKLKEYNLKSITIPWSFIPTDSDWYENIDYVQNDFDSYDDYYDYSIQQITERIERVNSTIEKYLKEYDDEYGTNYSPTGFSRIYQSLFSRAFIK